MIGIDVVDVPRFKKVLERSPGMEARLFSKEERAYCSGKSDPVRTMAGVLAAKEAVMKAKGLGFLPAWARRIEISWESGGAPTARIEGGESVSVTISHDGQVAVAAALAPDIPVPTGSGAGVATSATPAAEAPQRPAPPLATTLRGLDTA
jgi:holo-[acyl-carrier protein] synthase